MDTKSREIATNVAAKLAGDLVAAAVTSGQSPDDVVGAWSAQFSVVTEQLTQAIEAAEGAGKVAEAFTGTTTQSWGPQDQTSAQPQQQPQPAPVPHAGNGGGSKDDQVWRQYFANPNDFYDNRFDKRNPNGPDFKHKKTGDALWLSGRYPLPDWVQNELRTRGLVA